MALTSFARWVFGPAKAVKRTRKEEQQLQKDLVRGVPGEGRVTGLTGGHGEAGTPVLRFPASFLPTCQNWPSIQQAVPGDLLCVGPLQDRGNMKAVGRGPCPGAAASGERHGAKSSWAPRRQRTQVVPRACEPHQQRTSLFSSCCIRSCQHRAGTYEPSTDLLTRYMHELGAARAQERKEVTQLSRHFHRRSLNRTF